VINQIEILIKNCIKRDKAINYFNEKVEKIAWQRGDIP
jgi:hypothetical protein